MPAADTAFESLKIEYTVRDLLAISEQGGNWLIQDVLKPGGQMLISGPPKSGKSLLAEEIALMFALPFGQQKKRLFGQALGPPEAPLPFEVHPPPAGKDGYSVLFFSLEMGPPEVGHRIKLQLQQLGDCGQSLAEGKMTIPLFHVFGLPAGDMVRNALKIYASESEDRRSASDDTKDFDAVSKLIKEREPDLVIFDTLVQLHGEDENENVAMNGVMKAIRRLCRRKGPQGDVPITHIIIHHNRKGSGGGRDTGGADEMRGAGAVHGAVDIALILSTTRETDKIAVRVSSRSSSLKPFALRRTARLCHEYHDSDKDSQKARTPGKKELESAAFAERVLKFAEESGGAIKMGPELIAAIKKVPEFKHRSVPWVKGRIGEMKTAGLLVLEEGKKRIMEGSVLRLGKVDSKENKKSLEP